MHFDVEVDDDDTFIVVVVMMTITRITRWRRRVFDDKKIVFCFVIKNEGPVCEYLLRNAYDDEFMHEPLLLFEPKREKIQSRCRI